MLSKVRSFKVEKDIDITTHNVITLEIEEEDRDEETMQLKKLQSVKIKFDNLMKEYTEGCDDKEASDIRRNHTALVHGFIDEQLRKKQRQLQKHRKEVNTGVLGSVDTERRKSYSELCY